VDGHAIHHRSIASKSILGAATIESAGSLTPLRPGDILVSATVDGVTALMEVVVTAAASGATAGR
jgi:hypothetical protein